MQRERDRQTLPEHIDRDRHIERQRERKRDRDRARESEKQTNDCVYRSCVGEHDSLLVLLRRCQVYEHNILHEIHGFWKQGFFCLRWFISN